MIKELIDFFRYFWKTPNSDKSIVFYSEHEGYYPLFKDVIDELINNHGLTVCYITSDSSDSVLKVRNQKLNTFYINNLLSIFMIIVDCKAFIMTLTDLNQFHIKRSINPVHYIYMFHSPVSTTLAYLPGAFDHYDTLLCVGPYQIEEIKQNEKRNNLKPKNLIEAGYSSIEKISEEYDNFSKKRSTSNVKTICIAPSWGDDNILEIMGEQLVNYLLNENFKVIVRPHPETVIRKRYIIENLNNIFIENNRFSIDWTVSNIDSLIKSDILICDLSGVAIEYAFGTLRPVLFLDSKRKIRNDSYMDLGIEPFELKILKQIGSLVNPNHLQSIKQNIDTLISTKHMYKKKILKLREKSIYNFGHSKKNMAKYIFEVYSKNGKQS